MRQKSGPEKQPAEDAITACRRHGARRDFRRGEGSPPRSASVEGGRGRSHARKPIAQKKHDRGWGRRGMRYSASDKTEIIRLVEQSHLPTRRTLEKLGIPRSSFYRWYDRYQRGGPEGSRIVPHGQIGSGTVSQRLSVARLLTWRWISRN